jgi:hypothetical protein
MKEYFALDALRKAGHYIVEVTEGVRRKGSFEGAEVGTAICNSIDNKLELVDAEFARIHGYAVAELTGVHVTKLLPRDEGMEQILKYESIPCWVKGNTTFEAVHTKKDGSIINVFVYIAALEDELWQCIH